ncbi:DUF485 domain-containing protein [Patulibacter americanus]|uniref:DUF485 domain-containing protein n=1 Tax=Patulibacter americanus TaxID=588672 RepID=UPI0003B35356|nr:DUF485 domain-containing protein [Patulibacter americanus]
MDTPDTPPTDAAPPPRGTTPEVATWQQVAETPEFQELVQKKRAWIVPATVFFLFWYLLFILMAGYAEDFMGSEFLVDGLTVGYVFALSQFVMTFGLALAYVRRSRDVFDPLRVRALERAAEIANEPIAPGTTGTAGTPGARGTAAGSTDPATPGPHPTDPTDHHEGDHR